MPNILTEVVPPIPVKTILTCLLWYLVSSITSQLTKLILVKFSYPLFLSQFQFLIGASLALVFITIVRKLPKTIQWFPLGSVPIDSTRPIFNKSVLIKVLPLGLFQFCGKYFSLNATSLIPLATVSSIKALSPLLIVAGYRLIYNVKFPLITYLSLTPLVGGVMLIIASGSSNSTSSKTNLLANEYNEFDHKQIKGLIFCLISTFIFASQNIYGKQLITWDSDETTKNPTSLVLNTDPSRPSTPHLVPDSTFVSEESLPDKRKFIRLRTNSIRLPYSTSDIRLDEKKEEISLQQSVYNQTVQQNYNTLKNPFAPFRRMFETEKISKPDKMTIILYCSMIGFFFSFSGFVMKELPSIRTIYSDESTTVHATSNIITVLVLILLNSISHFLQTLLAFHLLGSIPALSYSIASMMKRIVLITVSIILAAGTTANNSDHDSDKWFGKISNEQIYGLILIAVGLYSYDRWGSRSLKAN